MAMILAAAPTYGADIKAADLLKEARSLKQDKRWEEAAKAYEAAMKTNPQRREALTMRLEAACCWMKLQKPDRALAVLEGAAGNRAKPGREAVFQDALNWVRKGTSAFPCYKGDYADFHVPPTYAKRAEELNLGKTTDICVDLLRRLTGADVKPKKRQVVQYNPLAGGGAHSGNPVEIGPGFFSADEDRCWGAVLTAVHELGHNFHARVPNLGALLHGNTSAQALHHMCVLESVWFPATLTQEGLKLGLSRNAMSLLAQHNTMREKKARAPLKVLADYEAFIAGGGKQAAFKDQYFIGVGVWTQLVKEKGLDICPRFFREIAALPAPLVGEAKRTVKQNALIVLAITRACGEDQVDRFSGKWGFPVDHAFYVKAKEAMKGSAPSKAAGPGAKAADEPKDGAVTAPEEDDEAGEDDGDK